MATHQELQTMAGHLAHANKVVRGSRTFSRCRIDAIKLFPNEDKFLVIPSWVKFDLGWCLNLWSLFNGVSKVIQSCVETDYVETGDVWLWRSLWC